MHAAEPHPGHRPGFSIPYHGPDLDSVAMSEVLIQSISVVGLVNDQAFGEVVEKAVPEDFFNQLVLVPGNML